MTQTDDAPKWIFAWVTNGDMGGWAKTRGSHKTNGITEYVRADIATQPDPMDDPRVRELADAAKKAETLLLSFGMRPEFYRKASQNLRAALAAFDTTGGKADE